MLTYSGFTGEVSYLTKKYKIIKSITSDLKSVLFPEVIAMLTSIDGDDSGGESETEEGDVLDWELCSSDAMSNDEETEQFDDVQPIIHVGNLQTADTNVETHSATCFDDDSGSGTTESWSTHEIARYCT